MTGALVLAATLGLAGLAGLVWRVRQGRVRPVGSARPGGTLPAVVRAALDPAAPDGTVTLVQLSTTFCAPCRQTRVLLTDLAARTDGLRHIELDLTDRVDLARELSVLRTPTTIAVDAHGAELLRVGGVPRREALLEALRPHLE